MIITRTPFRISFFGGGTDYPTWFQEHGGVVLGTTIDKYCYISLRELPPLFARSGPGLELGLHGRPDQRAPGAGGADVLGRVPGQGGGSSSR